MGVNQSRDKDKLRKPDSDSTGIQMNDGSSLLKGDNKQFEDVVISGLSCRLPESDNMVEFRDNLLNGVDMVTEDNRRWEPGIHGLPKGNGKLKDLSKFDNEFFGVSPKQAETMDPQLRMLLEVGYEAIVDAGQCPELIKGSNTGVFIGTSGSESFHAWSRDLQTVAGYTMTGSYPSMLANRLSYFFDFKGPSLVLDTACSTTLHALHIALQNIRSGHCDSALVGGSHLCLDPSYSVQFQRLGALADDGRCKPFDAKADGYTRSEGIVVLFLQKSIDARRIYCHVVNTGVNNDGYKHQGITYPSSEMQVKLLESVYSEVNLDPNLVSYVEAHGTGTPAGDTEEAESISNFYGKKRKEPILIGSVKSNMGHCESVSGLASIAKVTVAMEKGVIPGNLHFNGLDHCIKPLQEGNIRVVDKNTGWDGGYVGINSFGFGGSNAHVILKSHNNSSIQSGQKLRKNLICCSSRTEKGVKQLLQEAQHLSTSDEFLSLMCAATREQAKMNGYRGFKVLNGTPESIAPMDLSDKRPVWYVFTGTGCQWPGMGRQMMNIDLFRKTILKCGAAVRPYGIYLEKILSQDDDTVIEDVTNSAVAIIAVQVALVDILRSIGVKPDGYIGHSIGEIGCAYADGCLTAEEAVLVAYWRGTCIKEAALPPGQMAAIGMTWEEAIKRCPSGVVPACHNALDSVTVSGPKQTVEDFVKEMREYGVFAKEVDTSGIAFHSYFIRKAETSMLSKFKGVITNRKLRSDKWISTSIKQQDIDSQMAKYSSPEYHVNNTVSPVLFHEALQHVHKHAIVIEIAPHNLLKAILKRSLSTGCYITGLMHRYNADNEEHFFSNLGHLYLKGVSVAPQSLLEPVTYPVGRGTPMLAPLITWNHEQNWPVPTSDMFSKSSSVDNHTFNYQVDMSNDSDWSYLNGHKIDGRVLFPAAGYLLIAWKAFVKCKGQQRELPVTFQDVQWERATVIQDSVKVNFDVALMPGTGAFEINEGGSVVASGRIFDTDFSASQISSNDNRRVTRMNVSSSDIYKELHLRGYEYSGLFKGIMKTDVEGRSGLLYWSGHFVPFIDAMIQFATLSDPTFDLRLPTRMKSLSIDPRILLGNEEEKHDIYVERNANTDLSFSVGIEIKGLGFSHANLRKDDKFPSVEICQLLPQDRAIQISKSIQEQEIATISVQIAYNIVKRFPSVPAVVMATSTLTVQEGNTCIEELDQILNEVAENVGGEKYKLMNAFREHLAADRSGETEQYESWRRHSQIFKKALFDDEIFSVKTEHVQVCIDMIVENRTDKLKILDLSESKLQDKIKQRLKENGAMIRSYDRLHVGANSKPIIKSMMSFRGMDLVVCDNILHTREDLEAFLHDCVKSMDDGGFLLIKEATKNLFLHYIIDGILEDPNEAEDVQKKYIHYHTYEQLKDVFKSVGLVIIVEVQHPFLYSMFLLRKKNKRPSANNKVISVSNLDCEWLEDLQRNIQEMRAKENADDVIWLYADNDVSGIIGMTKCLRKEPDGHRIRCVLNRMTKHDKTMQEIVDELLEKDLTINILTDDGVYSYMFLPCKQETSQQSLQTYSYLDILTVGDLSSLTWFQTPSHALVQTASHEICSVEFASLNFRDVMLATGKLNPDAIPGNIDRNTCPLGMEFSGSDAKRKRVMGIASSKALATMVSVRKECLWEIPHEWSFQEAASIPVAYSTVYYALVVRGSIGLGQSILIHSGSGGVGQAAIALAVSLKCEVFTTVGTEEKKAYLLSVFPELKAENIFSSRNTSFENRILDATAGNGVDIVLNSLSGDKLRSSLNVVALHGCFLELGKYDLYKDTALGMSIFLRNISFHGIVLDSLFETGGHTWNRVYRLVEEGIRSGVVRPLKTTVFNRRNVEGAFRYMTHGNHIGKVLLQIECNGGSEEVDVVQKVFFDPKKSYVIIGGLGGVGLELAEWMAIRGARSITMTSRSGVKTGYQTRKIHNLRKMGIDVKVCRQNASNFQEAEEIVDECRMPCGGIFNTAMVLQDGLIENQTVERFQKVIEPKLYTAINLDKITRKRCRSSCDLFVMFSSFVSHRGNEGQSNYGFANSGMDMICEQRRRDGLHGLAIQWGPIGDVGALFEQYGNDKEIAGTYQQPIRSCLATLDALLTQSAPIVTSYMHESNKKKQLPATDEGCLLTAVCNIIGINNASKVDNSMSLEQLGLDSLMSVEVKQTIERLVDMRLSTTEIRKLTLQRIEDIDNEKRA